MPRLIALTGVLALALLAAAVAHAEQTGRFTQRGTVVSVADGDTISVRLTSGKRERVRLIGIDTPELSGAQCYGREASRRTRQLAQGARVRLVGDATQATRDRYGRLLAYVGLQSGADLGRQLLAEGFGRVYVYGRPFVRLSSYRAAEQGAKSKARGLWRTCVGTTQPPAPNPNCAASYPGVCIPPPPPDLDCGEIAHRNFAVTHAVADPDPHGFDGDRDGIGCET